MPTPVAVFAFNRPEHLQRTLTALADNELASESDVTIFCDGPRGPGDAALTSAVRKVARAAAGFRSCAVVERERNYGLAPSIITGVTELLERHDRLIVLEDDLVTSPYFLRYMNDGLELYAENPKVASIHGWCFPNAVKNSPETFFLRGTDCWGWATWKRAWSFFEPDAAKLLMELHRRGLVGEIDRSYDYSGMLRDVLQDKVSSWAVRWHAAAFLAGMYTLFPGRSLVRNIGLDASGTHCGKEVGLSGNLSSSPVLVKEQPVVENAVMREALGRAYVSGRNSPWRQAAKAVLKDWLPPPVFRLLKRLREARNIESELRWEGDYPDWQSAVTASGGYDRQDIFTKVRDAARAVRDGRALWERDSVLFYHEEYNLPLIAALMSVAAWNKGRLRVLDFGGAFGSTYMQHRPVLDGLEALAWNVVEQPHIVACGQDEFSSGALRFWPDMSACAESGPVDVVLFSSVLQYMEDPYDLLRQAIALRPRAVIIDRTPFAGEGERITVQRVPPEIYEASYPCRWLDKSKAEAILRDSLYLGPWWQSAVDPLGFQGVFCYHNGK